MRRKPLVNKNDASRILREIRVYVSEILETCAKQRHQMGSNLVRSVHNDAILLYESLHCRLVENYIERGIWKRFSHLPGRPSPLNSI